ncbi:MAG: universal stress protein [bacterium]
MGKRYLTATDGEESSTNLIDYIERRFETEDNQFDVISVADEARVIPYLMAEEGGTGGIDPSTVNERLKGQAEEVSEHAVGLLNDRGYEAESIVRFGNPGPEICQRADEEDYAEILISRRSHTAVGELLLGSVSQYVIHHSSIPVSLVPMDED